MSNVSYNNVIDCVTSGIQKATSEHLKLTNNLTELGWGPEYFLTVNIANELKKLEAAHIFLEEPMGDSQDKPKGRPPSSWGKRKRYDIVVRRSDTNPYAAIEVKHRVYSLSDGVRDDFRRLAYAVKPKSDGEKIFNLGIFAFYTVFYGDKSDTNKQKKGINNLYLNLEEELLEYAEIASVDKELFPPKPYEYDRSIVWGGGCFILKVD